MTYELIKVRLPYRQCWKRNPRLRLPNCSWFEAQVDVRIDEISAASAPVAYEVSLAARADRSAFHYEIRSYDNRLWWPLGGEHSCLDRETFKGMLEAEGSRLEYLTLLDPYFPDYHDDWPLPPFPESESQRVDHELNDFANREAVAKRGAVQTIICNGGIFVSAGEPLFYFTGEGKHLFPWVGVSDEDRECANASFGEPGPTRLQRKDCARRGFVFAIGELDEGMRVLRARGYSFEQNFRVEIRLERHQPQTAVSMCARTLVSSLFDRSRGNDDVAEALRTGVPILGNVVYLSEARDLRAEVLHQMRSSSHPILSFKMRQEKRAAAFILDRLGPLGLGVSLAAEEDEALEALANF
ncbi:hypothetical protein [Bradyrhizobium sp. 131]|uniref:hypothetical protein n=1 Tax=Bradyrhizobium sp. 131 TaxID=2782609 RepID=UPI001FFF85D1|nr:hypothetical protein [Bradyrhizobium sp. 131]UPK19136.1 hypothetical protein IVA73_34785 [Bradyrhizobium sp. 131]